MSMSKKDFIALADTLRDVMSPEYSSADNISKDTVIDRLCTFMRGQNPQFNEERWRDYLAGNCGPSGGKVK